LFEESWQQPIARFRSNYAFRGMSDASFALETSLRRLGGRYADHEAHLLRNFRKYAWDTPLDDSVWAWLALGQHHGLPTRLLDWTYSPLVAMHFATVGVEWFHQDGVIWCVDFVRAIKLLPQRLRRLLAAEGSNVFTLEMLDRGAPTLQSLARLARNPFALFMEPPSFDQRIVNQHALFSLMSTASARLDEWLKANPQIARCIVIPAGLKQEIRDKLDQANVTERVLLPGLDGLCRWLTRHYAPPLAQAALETRPLRKASRRRRHRDSIG
jgi:hypothetical protein